MGDARHFVYLVPGFFGFANFGEFKYFAHVRRALEAGLRARGVTPELHEVRVLPTASLPRRAAALLAVIRQTWADGAPISIVGHSTGGLDARLLMTPDVELPTGGQVDDLAPHVRAVVSVTSPHRGTPLADKLASVLGQQLLRLLSAMTIHSIRVGRVPLPIMTRVADIFGPLGALVGAKGGLLEELYRDVLRDFTPEQARHIEAFFRQVASDSSLLPQLGASAMELFNTRCSLRPGLRYGSVVLQARPPTLRGALRSGSPFDQASYAIFRAIYTLTASGGGAPRPGPAQEAALRAAFGALPDPAANDAIVPTLSQVWGEVLACAWGDHLDVLGHFDGGADDLHNDWLRSLSDFRVQDFDRIWARVADFIAA
ncbi:MAG: triacylglycerol lipase [Myxococcales bacterium]|nr:triacylglycerol lipase [Myxococcales bacterium]